MTIKAIETHYNGYRFRSRTEARWAIFFENAGISFDYEPQGFVLDGISYLPDFWLPQAKFWFEVKGEDPTEREYALCYALAAQTGCPCVLAVGPPNEDRHNLLVIWGRSEDDEYSLEQIGKARIEDDRRNDGEYWLASEYGMASKFLTLPNGVKHDRAPGLRAPSLKAYKAAKSARFEHGEAGA